MCPLANAGSLRGGLVMGILGLVAVAFALADAAVISGSYPLTGTTSPVPLSPPTRQPIHRLTGLQAILHPDSSNRTLTTRSSRDTCPGPGSGRCVNRWRRGARGAGLLLGYARLYLVNTASAARGYPFDPTYGPIMAAPPIRTHGPVGPEYWAAGGQLLPERGGLRATPAAPRS
jgi:hypothetical protein